MPKSDGFILTSNRDETRSRNARELVCEQMDGGHEVFYPKDIPHGGTWLAASDLGYVVCILNGAFEPYDRSVVYERSRGAIPIYMLEHLSIERLFNDFPMHHVAPYTMIYYDGERLHEVRYDGNKVFHLVKDGKRPHIWSSVTLYDEEIRKQRLNYFKTFLQHNETVRADALMSFHGSQPFGDGQNDFIMNREGKVETVSITQVIVRESDVYMIHNDLISNESKEIMRRRKPQ